MKDKRPIYDRAALIGDYQSPVVKDLTSGIRRLYDEAYLSIDPYDLELLMVSLVMEAAAFRRLKTKVEYNKGLG